MRYFQPNAKILVPESVRMNIRCEKKRLLQVIASDYFDYLGRHLPQHCANDEFYFFPRSEAAIDHLSTLDDLTPEGIQGHVKYVQDLLKEIPQEEQDDLEGEIDRVLLRQSMGSFIREFGDREVWRNDPTLYVKIPLFATEQVISQSDGESGETAEKLSNLFAQIPPFLDLAVKNLRSLSEVSLQVAIKMAQDALHFYNRDVRLFIKENAGSDKELLAKNTRVLEAWDQYKEDLRELTSRKSFAIGEDNLNKIFAVSLNYPKSSKEILEISQYGYQKTQEKLHLLAMKIDSRKPWNRIIYEQLPSVSSPGEVLQLFRNEVQELRRFFCSQDIFDFPSEEKISVLKTPSYLQSLRATASYQAPLTGNTKGHGIFYITPGREDLGLIAAHSPYLSAHETYPGHHILDHLRIHHYNPIRPQIESPLFYEGWACYAELLLDELGYIQEPRRQIIQLKRQLWRCLRAMLDVRLQTGKITLNQAAREVEKIGFPSKRAQRQVRRFCLTPGYQSCYFLGMYEIMRLREEFSSRLKAFHNIFLGGGEIPFYLVEKRLKTYMP